MGVLDGQAAIITGAGMGIGAAVARRFAVEGARVAVFDTNADAGRSIAEAIAADGGEACAEVCDVSQADQVSKAVAAVADRWQHIDALVNCAGIYDVAGFLEIDLANWNRVLGVDLTGTFLVWQAVARKMAVQGGGAIVCIASIQAHAAEGYQASYNAAKAGVIALVQSAAMELAPKGIRVNSISPGAVETPMVASYVTPGQLDYMRGSFARVPMDRLIRPEEIAAAALFLCSDEASAITGADLLVDGGVLATSYIDPTIPQI